MAGEATGFGAEEVERATRYHRPLYAGLAVGLGLEGAVLSLLAFSGLGGWLYRWLGPLPVWGRSLAFPAEVAAASFLATLPLSFWQGHLRERRWGFSTQGVGGWLVDRVKGLAVGAVLSSLVLGGFLAVARVLPEWWPLAAAPAAAALVGALSFLGPVVLEPIFNRFSPLSDQVLAAELRTLADRAGVPVRAVLVADASRRTRKRNAYVSGVGPSRRVVLFDTLLESVSPAEVRVVAAHELGHRRLGHVGRGTVLGMAGGATGVAVLWAILRAPAVLGAVGARGPGDPRVVPFMLLVALGLEVLTLPARTALSRRWERQADRFSLDLTGDPEAFEVAHRALALANLADLDPPRPVYLAVFTHPAPPERIAEARRWAAHRRAGSPEASAG